MSALAVAEVEASPTALTVVPSLSEWTAEQVSLIKSTLTTDLTDAEFSLFAQVCLRTGLDPFIRQIYAIKRRQRQGTEWVERMTIQTGIDGYRVTAERTGEYVGGDAPAYGPPCACGDEKFGAHPEWAEVTVRRMKASQVFATAERADFHEYVVLDCNGAPQGLWQKMPKRMLAKCAEALALRRAFPSLLQGVYTQEEMDQADNPAAEVITTAAVEVPAIAATETSRAEVVIHEPQAGDPCPQCREETSDGRICGFFRIAKGGRLKGQLQCTGHDRSGKWFNHPAMPMPIDDPTEIPF